MYLVAVWRMDYEEVNSTREVLWREKANSLSLLFTVWEAPLPKFLHHHHQPQASSIIHVLKQALKI